MKKRIIFYSVFMAIIIILTIFSFLYPYKDNLLFFFNESEYYESENNEFLMTAKLTPHAKHPKDIFLLTTTLKNKTDKTVHFPPHGFCEDPFDIEFSSGFNSSYYFTSPIKVHGCIDTFDMTVTMKPNETIKKQEVIRRSGLHTDKLESIEISSNQVPDIVILLE